MRDIIRALQVCGKKAVEDRSKALQQGDYIAVLQAEEHIGLLHIATNRLMEVINERQHQQPDTKRSTGKPD